MPVLVGICQGVLNSIETVESQTKKTSDDKNDCSLKHQRPTPRNGYGVHFAVSHLSIIDTDTELMYPSTSLLHSKPIHAMHQTWTHAPI